jgi:hypothetical protein
MGLAKNEKGTEAEICEHSRRNRCNPLQRFAIRQTFAGKVARCIDWQWLRRWTSGRSGGPNRRAIGLRAEALAAWSPLNRLESDAVPCQREGIWSSEAYFHWQVSRLAHIPRVQNHELTEGSGLREVTGPVTQQNSAESHTRWLHRVPRRSREPTCLAERQMGAE